MNPIVEKVMDEGKPYSCPQCGAKLKCFFHERDSTSDSMNCPKCFWWAHSGWDGEWTCSEDLTLPDKVNVSSLLDKVSKDMEKACRGYIFDSITPDGLEKMRLDIGQTLQRFVVPERNINEYLVITPSVHDRNVILIGPRDDAPSWVFELFEHINQTVKTNEENRGS